MYHFLLELRNTRNVLLLPDYAFSLHATITHYLILNCKIWFYLSQFGV